MPSYASNLAILWSRFDVDIWRREVGWSKRFNTNMLRVWLDWHSWLALGDEFWEYLDKALAVLAEYDIQMMPVLYNRWCDVRYPMGMVTDRDLMTADSSFGKFRQYITELLERFGADERIGIWDLCNEPQAWGQVTDLESREVSWLKQTADKIRQSSNIPITIGTMVGENVRLYADLVDVISFHPYPRVIGDMEQLCENHLEIAKEYGRELICTETCCGALNDIERGHLAEDNVRTLKKYGIGWLIWQLCEGKFVTGNRERVDNNSIRDCEGYMPFVLADGSTRPGHEWLELL